MKDVRVKLEKVKLSDLSQELQLPDSLKGLIGFHEANKIEAKVVYDQFEVDLMTEESAGVRRLFQMICPDTSLLDTDLFRRDQFNLLGISLSDVADRAFYQRGETEKTKDKLRRRLNELFGRRNIIAHQTDDPILTHRLKSSRRKLYRIL